MSIPSFTLTNTDKEHQSYDIAYDIQAPFRNIISATHGPLSIKPYSCTNTRSGTTAKLQHHSFALNSIKISAEKNVVGRYFNNQPFLMWGNGRKYFCMLMIPLQQLEEEKFEKFFKKSLSDIPINTRLNLNIEQKGAYDVNR